LAGSYLFIFSENGILERRELQKKYYLLIEKINFIKENNSSLNNECEKYKAGKFSNKDLIDSGFASKTGKILYINDSIKDQIKADGASQGNRDEFDDDFNISLKHLRIIWIIFSVIFLFIYYLKYSKNRESTDGPDINRLRSE
jgi:hypothetical protein